MPPPLRFVAEIVLVGLIIAVGLTFGGRALLMIPAQFIAEVKIDHRDELQLYYNSGHGFNEGESSKLLLQPQKAWQRISHPLPHMAIRTLRIDPLLGKGELGLRRLQLCRLGKCVDLMTSASQFNGILYLKQPDGAYRLKAFGDDPQFLIEAIERFDHLFTRRAYLLLLGFLLPLGLLVVWIRFYWLRTKPYQPSSAQPIRALPAILFVLIIWLPLVSMPFGLPDISERYELRHHADKPEFLPLKFAEYPGKFEKYFNDHFGLRGYLVAAGNWLALSLFPGDSPDKRVVIGQSGWLYFSGEPPQTTINDYQGRIPFSQHELETIRQHLLKQQAWLAQRGIHYLLVIAPNKESIYPEHLPQRLQHTVGPTRMDQLATYLSNHPAPAWIDLRTILRQAKSSSSLPLFYSTDSHWNKYGAFIGYQAIFNAGYQRGWTPAPKLSNDFLIQSKPGFMGDLAQMLLAVDRYPDQMIKLQPRTNCRLHVIEPSTNHDIPEFVQVEKILRRYSSDCGNEDPLLVLHDSFSWDLIPYIAPHYRQSYFLQSSSLMVNLIERIKPKLLVHEYVERDLKLILEAAIADENIQNTPIQQGCQ